MPSPITCLGMTFTTEDERRSYFCNELREKLPELRKIVGFPIGTDDDIVNLSDPPYYTTCPNPWLNDFITHWNEEKKVLEISRKRISGIEVHEPYTSDVSEGKNNPIYTAHSYHTKVPHPAIMRYILHYTQPGDIVFDGFAGTGMTGVAVQLCGNPDLELKMKIDAEFKQIGQSPPTWGSRKSICSDLSPIASFMAYNYNTSRNVESFEKEVQKVLKVVEKECGWMYSTKHTNGQHGRINYAVWSDIFLCSSCGGEIVFWDAAVNEDLGEVLDDFKCPSCHSLQNKRSVEKAIVTVFDNSINGTTRRSKSIPVLYNYTYSGKRYNKTPDSDDIALINTVDQQEIQYWFPSDPMMGKGNEWGDTWRSGVHEGVTHVHQFYTKRNLIVLSKIYEQASDPSIKFLFTSLLSRSSRLVMTVMSNYFAQLKGKTVGGWAGKQMNGTLYIPSISTEVSPIESIETRLSSLKKLYYNTRTFKKDCIVNVSSASSQLLSDDSVDYIFTDPPFGANIMYSELNFHWESWIKVKTNNKAEAIESKAQGKSLLEYQNLMHDCFQEYYRVLKPGRWMTVEFSNTSAAVWNGIQTAIQRAGFVIANVAALDKKQGSIKAVTTPTAVKQDLIISCYKPSGEFDKKFRTESGEVNIWTFVEEHLKHLPVSIVNDQKTTAVIERSPKILYDRLITFYLMRGLPIPIDAVEFQIKLKQKFKESDGMIFTAVQCAQYEDQKVKEGITPQLSLVFDIIYSESDAVEWLKARLAKGSQKYQDIQPDFRKANTATRKGEKEFELQILLNENFIPLPDGRYRVPDMNEAKDREHFRIAALLKEFNKYIEELANPKTKKLKDLRVEALREGFKSSWQKKDFVTIVNVAEKIPQNLLMEDEYLLNFYDIAKDRV